MAFEKKTMPEHRWYDIGELFQGHSLALGAGKYKLNSDIWYGIHNGKKVVFKIINKTYHQPDDGGELTEILRVERETKYSVIPNGKKFERFTTYQRIPIPGVSENSRDLVPEQITKNVVKRFIYEKISEGDEYRYTLAQIVTQTDMLCVTNGEDAEGNDRDPFPVHLQLQGISYKVSEGTQIKFIEGWAVSTQSFSGDEIISVTHEISTGIVDVETSVMNSPPIEINLSEPCVPLYKRIKVVRGDKAGKTKKIKDSNLIIRRQVEEMAETILKVNSWVKQIDRQKTYLGIIPIQVIGKSAGNVGYTISVDHMAPSATTTISHREMIEEGDE